LVGWGIVFSSLTLFYPVIELQLTIANRGRERKYCVAIGGGCAKDAEDAVVCYDFQLLKKCLLKANNQEVGEVRVPKYNNEATYQLS